MLRLFCDYTVRDPKSLPAPKNGPSTSTYDLEQLEEAGGPAQNLQVGHVERRGSGRTVRGSAEEWAAPPRPTMLRYAYAARGDAQRLWRPSSELHNCGRRGAAAPPTPRVRRPRLFTERN